MLGEFELSCGTGWAQFFVVADILLVLKRESLLVCWSWSALGLVVHTVCYAQNKGTRPTSRLFCVEVWTKAAVACCRWTMSLARIALNGGPVNCLNCQNAFRNGTCVFVELA